MTYFRILLMCFAIFSQALKAEEAQNSIPKEDFQSMFIQKEQSQDQSKAEDFFISAADTYNAEGDYEKAISLLQKVENQDTAQWCDIAATAYLGNRNYAQAKEAFTCAKTHYEQQGDMNKVRQMQAHIHYLTPAQ